MTHEDQQVLTDEELEALCEPEMKEYRCAFEFVIVVTAQDKNEALEKFVNKFRDNPPTWNDVYGSAEIEEQ